IFIVGGHGAMFDLAKNADLHNMINIVYELGGIISAVCHGPAPLVFTKTKEGRPLLEGLDVTGYTNAPDSAEVRGLLPFSLEDELSKVGNYSKSEDQDQFVVWANERILTGRDPQSSELFGKELAKALTRRELEQEEKYFD